MFILLGNSATAYRSLQDRQNISLAARQQITDCLVIFSTGVPSMRLGRSHLFAVIDVI